MCVKEAQFMNASFPILRTLGGIIISSNNSQFLKAAVAIFCVFSGSCIPLSFEQFANVFAFIFVRKRQVDKSTTVKLLQFSKTDLPSFLRFAGISADANKTQFLNAASFIFLTFFGMSMDNNSRLFSVKEGGILVNFAFFGNFIWA